MVAGSSRELIDTDGVECRERPELLEDGPVECGAIHWNRQVRVSHRPAQQSTQGNRVYIHLLWQMPPLSTNIGNGKNIVQWQFFLNRQTHVGDSGDFV